MKRKPTPEGALLRLVLAYLAARHIFALRMNTGTLRDSTGRPVTFGTPGMSYILAFPHFRLKVLCSASNDIWHEAEIVIPTWLELKAPEGEQSELQKSFQERVESEGHRYVVCRSLEDVEAALR